jgi:hypothetical protein
LLDLSPTLHSEVDRPDSEASFRMALWPPLCALIVYFTSTDSKLWLIGLLLPAVLAAQWIYSRNQAHGALRVAIRVRPELQKFVHDIEAGALDVPTSDERKSLPRDDPERRTVAATRADDQSDDA